MKDSIGGVSLQERTQREQAPKSPEETSIATPQYIVIEEEEDEYVFIGHAGYMGVTIRTQRFPRSGALGS